MYSETRKVMQPSTPLATCSVFVCSRSARAIGQLQRNALKEFSKINTQNKDGNEAKFTYSILTLT